MDRLKDFHQVCSHSFKKTIEKTGKSYLALAFIFLSLLLENNNVLNIGIVGNLSGLISYLLDVLVLCFVVQALKSVVLYGNSGKKSIGNSINMFFQPLLSTMFYLYIVNLFVDILVMGADSKGQFIVKFIVRLLTSALLEEVYIGNRHGLNALTSSVKFVIDNLLTYGLCAGIFLAIESVVSIKLQASLGNNAIILTLLVALIHTFFCIFRGHLFKYTDEHPYRQRKFMRG